MTHFRLKYGNITTAAFGGGTCTIVESLVPILASLVPNLASLVASGPPHSLRLLPSICIKICFKISGKKIGSTYSWKKIYKIHLISVSYSTVTQAKLGHNFRLLYNNRNPQLRSCWDMKIRVTRAAKSAIRVAPNRGSAHPIRVTRAKSGITRAKSGITRGLRHS